MNEKALIQQLRQRSEPAFRFLVDSYQKRVYNTVLGILLQEADADDVTQEVFIQVFESIDRFREASGLSTWIYRIAVHKALDKLRRRKVRKRLQQWLPWHATAVTEDEPQSFYHPGIALDKKENAQVLFHAISRLPEKQRVAFTLVRIQGLPQAEAALVLGQSIKAIESLLGRARQNLQEILQQHYNEHLKNQP